MGLQVTDNQARSRFGTLVQSALEAVRARNLEVLPNCPFVRSWITGHREYADLVPADRRSQFGL